MFVNDLRGNEIQEKERHFRVPSFVAKERAFLWMTFLTSYQHFGLTSSCFENVRIFLYAFMFSHYALYSYIKNIKLFFSETSLNHNVTNVKVYLCITVYLTVCTQGTFQKFSVLQCKTCNDLRKWTLHTSALVSFVLSGVGYAPLMLSHSWVYTCKDCMIVLHVFGKKCNIKRKLMEIIAYKLAIFLKVAHEDYHRLASYPSFSLGSW